MRPPTTPTVTSDPTDIGASLLFWVGETDSRGPDLRVPSEQNSKKCIETQSTNLDILEVTRFGAFIQVAVTVNRFGFPVGYLMAENSVRGFRTGDIVRATVSLGKKRGGHVGRVAVRRTGSFNVQTAQATVQGVSHRHCRVVQRTERLRIRPRDVTESGDGNNARDTGVRIPLCPEGRGFLWDDLMTEQKSDRNRLPLCIWK